ncbi:DUF1801 domain-containing protein [Flavobacteriaceae bacterium TP-CH-4]|uniref:DUF1801 domain-containing protein n=1 Tax=Pelagihabitans pacificus TaxID=2696054 RepID=A0A967ECQ0_9FLAO|nr:DUF1801 domain-containing protein [Pelagihabitans pacificus]NHF58518.1 DUF1801 domain-containing protein [Pelagihabitans pacificus]
MTSEIASYHTAQTGDDRWICEQLEQLIRQFLPEAQGKIWHGHPVWFLNENPIVGYSKQKAGIRLMFWSGASFGEQGLNVLGATFKDASIFYTNVDQIDPKTLKRWLQKAREIQWDYKNIVKRKGELIRLK